MRPEELMGVARRLIDAGATAGEAFVRMAEDGHGPPPALAKAVCVVVTGVSWQRAGEIFGEVFMTRFAQSTDFPDALGRQRHIEIAAARLSRSGYFDVVPVHDSTNQQIHDRFLEALRLKGGVYAAILRWHRAGNYAATFHHLVRMAIADEVTERAFWAAMNDIADLLDADTQAQLTEPIAACRRHLELRPTTTDL